MAVGTGDCDFYDILHVPAEDFDFLQLLPSLETLAQNEKFPREIDLVYKIKIKIVSMRILMVEQVRKKQHNICAMYF